MARRTARTRWGCLPCTQGTPHLLGSRIVDDARGDSAGSAVRRPDGESSSTSRIRLSGRAIDLQSHASHVVLRGAGAALIVCLLALAACGGEDVPLTRNTKERGSGKSTSGTKTPAQVLRRLRDVLRDGKSLSNSSWQEDIEVVVHGLWPDDPRSEAAMLHRRLSMITADTARWLAGGNDARLEWELRHPLDVAIHDGYLRSTREGPQSYKDWCASEGAMLLDKKIREQMRQAMNR